MNHEPLNHVRRVDHADEGDRAILRQVYEWARRNPALYLDGSGYRDAEDFLEPPRSACEYFIFATGEPVALLSLIPHLAIGKVYQVALITDPGASLRKICKLLRVFQSVVFERLADALFVELPDSPEFLATRKLARFFGLRQISATEFLLLKSDYGRPEEKGSDVAVGGRDGGGVRALTRLIEATLALIARQLSERRNPVVACSFGKDSMVMLGLARRVKPDVTVIYFPGLSHPTKHLFVARMAKEWSLNLYAPYPRARDAISKDSHVELIELYELAPKRFAYFPVEATKDYEPDASAHCGLAFLNEEPVAAQADDFDAVFIGHRNDDQDPTHGSVPLKDYVVDAGDFRYVYPLRDWTEGDVWAASRLLGIPQNEARYRDRDIDADNDYHELCTRCFLGGSGRTNVICPKTGEETPTVFEEARLEENRDVVRRAFTNIA